MYGWRAYALAACATVWGAAAMCLVAVAIFMDLMVAERLGSVMGAIAGPVGLAISVWALAGHRGRGVEAHDGAVASGGHVGRVIAGNHNEVTQRDVTPQSACERQCAGLRRREHRCCG